MIAGTAGHIDHGKTAIVRALTGVDTDRLKEEKERGISIELGYAYTPLSNGGILGFVDVPGHERLVHTMAAGACGIDFALLVVAADDGIMPQTREHVAILELFGVSRCAVALTKIDRVDAARARAVVAEIDVFLESTSFGGAPVYCVNAVAGDDPGTQRLRQHLEDVATQVAAAKDDRVGRYLFRLAVDRVFTLAGHGTVAAGTVFSGKVRTGDTVAILPSGLSARVRSIHAQGRPVDGGVVGERCALNLVGVEKHAIKRGDWLADSRLLIPTTRIDVRLRLLGNSALKAWSPVHVHHGAAHRVAHVVPLEGSEVLGGESKYSQVVFDEAVCALPGDRFIVRDAQAMHTLGGGVVLDPFAQSRKRRCAERMRYLAALERVVSDGDLQPLLQEAPYGVRDSDLVRLTGREPEELPIPIGAVTVDCARERYVVLSTSWHSLRADALNALGRFHIDSPDEPGPDIGRLRRIAHPRMPYDLWRQLLAELADDGSLIRSDPWVHLPGHVVTLTTVEADLAKKLQPLIAAGRFDPPWVRDLAREAHAPEDTVRRVLRKQVTRGALFQVVNDLFYDRQCVEQLAGLVTNLVRQHGTVEAGQYRDAVGVGRKRAIQILEFFDRAGHTRRFRDSRVVRADSGWRNM